jgi:hypothetical protein
MSFTRSQPVDLNDSQYTNPTKQTQPDKPDHQLPLKLHWSATTVLYQSSRNKPHTLWESEYFRLEQLIADDTRILYVFL